MKKEIHFLVFTMLNAGLMGGFTKTNKGVPMSVIVLVACIPFGLELVPPVRAIVFLSAFAREWEIEAYCP